MTSNVAVFLFSTTTLLLSTAIFRAVGTHTSEEAILSLVIAAIAWALGSVTSYLFSAVREEATPRSFKIRWLATILVALCAAAWPWVGPGNAGLALEVVAMFAMGLLVPAVIGLQADVSGGMRDAFVKALCGCALGAGLSAGLYGCVGEGAFFLMAAAVTLFAPVLEPSLFFKEAKTTRRWFAIPVALAVLGLASMAPSAWIGEGPATSMTSESFATEAVYLFRRDRKFDVYMMGEGSTALVGLIKPATLEASVRSLTIAEPHPAALSEAVTKSVSPVLKKGTSRRLLASEMRRFDLIQTQMPLGEEGETKRTLDAHAESAVTVEALRLYFDRLKDDGFFQIVGHTSGARAQSTLATLAEAWKKSGRADIDLHAVAVTSQGGKTLETVILRMKPFLREERDRLGELLKVGKPESGNQWMLVSDASGAVLTDDQPLVGVVAPLDRTVLWIALFVVLGLIFWVSMQERRKELASRWQTASVATYFAGLGLSFAFFEMFFVLRAIRTWGVPSTAASLVLVALFLTLAAGATFFAGHPGRRYGVRIQPLANFVFAVMFTYLGASLVSPLMVSSSEWLSAFVGMSVLIPFGLLGGSFLPNALEEAGDKLAPRVLSLLWALYVAGTGLGIYLAATVSLESGLDVVFLIGLFCFAWVAIFSGLIRPWNVRKSAKGVS